MRTALSRPQSNRSLVGFSGAVTIPAATGITVIFDSTRNGGVDTDAGTAASGYVNEQAASAPTPGTPKHMRTGFIQDIAVKCTGHAVDLHVCKLDPFGAWEDCPNSPYTVTAGGGSVVAQSDGTATTGTLIYIAAKDSTAPTTLAAVVTERFLP